MQAAAIIGQRFQNGTNSAVSVPATCLPDEALASTAVATAAPADSCAAVPCGALPCAVDTLVREPSSAAAAPSGKLSLTLVFLLSKSRLSRNSSDLMSEACWYRSSGSFSSARLIMSSSFDG